MRAVTVVAIVSIVAFLMVAVPLWQIASDVKRIRVLIEWWWKLSPNAPVHPHDPRLRSENAAPLDR